MKVTKVLFQDEQYAVVYENAKRVGLSVASYLRFLALNNQSIKLSKQPIKIIREVKPVKIKLS